MLKTNCENYFPHIDGLRGIAILLVISFHFFPTIAPNGYIGVDIFFVISGFLITRIIFYEINKNKFSTLNFYQRRIKRLFPSLIITLLGSSIIATFYLTPDEFISFLKYSLGGTFFYTNFIASGELNYFESATKFKPLIHLWSLAIEEQFYIIFPILIFFFSKKKIKLFILFLCLISLILNFFYYETNPKIYFYLSHFRFWEIAIGSLIFFITQKEKYIFSIKKFQNYLNFFGIFLIILPHLNIINFVHNLNILLSVLGSSLIILSEKKSIINKFFLSNKILIYIGLISYPLYLYHWPILVFLKFHFGEILSRETEFLSLLVIFLAASLTYHFIEKHVRNNKKINYTLLLLLILILNLNFSHTFLKEINKSNFTYEQLTQIKSLNEFEKKNKKIYYEDQNCFLTSGLNPNKQYLLNQCLTKKNTTNKTLFLVGDSHSAGLAIGLKKYFDDMKYNFLQMSMGYCEPTYNGIKLNNCYSSVKFIEEIIIKEEPDYIFFHSNWLGASKLPWFEGSDYLFYFENYIKKISRMTNAKIFIIGQMPLWEDTMPNIIIKDYIRRKVTIPNSTFLNLEKDSIEIDTEMKKINFPMNVKYFSIKDQLCDTRQGCQIKLGNDITDIIVWTRGHMTLKSSLFIAEKIFEIFKNEM